MIFIIILSFFPIIPLFNHYSLILQQQYYESKRFYLYHKNNLMKTLLIKLVILLVSGIELYLIFNINQHFKYLIFTINIFSILVIFKKKIIKLKITSRIKRLFISTILLFLFTIFTSLLINEQSTYFVIFGFYFLFDLLINLSKFLIEPIEYLIRNHYVKEAKKKLSRNKELIIIGISGSYGKTSTKNILAKMLEAKYYILTTKGSINTKMGLVKTINDNLNIDHQIFIAEMGIDKKRGMEKLLTLFDLDYGLLTSIGSQHLSTFKTIDNIIKEKMKLLESIKVSGISFINNDEINIINNLKKIKSKMITYSTINSADFKVENITYNSQGSSFELIYQNKKYPFKSNLLGCHNISNILSALGVAVTLKVPIALLQEVVANLTPTAHRLEKKEIGNKIILDDAYNSNLKGFLAALEVLSKFSIKKILITPGLVEQGKEWYKNNYQLGKAITNSADYVILVNQKNTLPIADYFKKENFKEYIVVSTTKEAISFINQLHESAVVLIENDLPDIFI